MLPKTGTVKELLEQNQGNAPGFDALRVIFCVLILWWHAYCLATGAKVIDVSVSYVVLRGILPMFFFLAGFLVTSSALRLRSLKSFFIFRSLRIFPALIVEVLLSAIVLGGLVTTLPLSEYYSHPDFYAYFKNIFGFVRFFLPGVFESNPLPYVNYNLWTLPGELYCYIGLFVLMATTALYRRQVVLFLSGIATYIFLYYFHTRISGGFELYTIVVYVYFLPYSFLLGCLSFLYADKIILNKKLFLLAALSMVALCSTTATIIGIFGACYLCLYLGFVDMRRFPLIHKGDFSYGIYLYGYPIQQALVFYFAPMHNPWILAAVSLPVTILFAMASWYGVEKPVLSLRKRFGRAREDVRIDK